MEFREKGDYLKGLLILVNQHTRRTFDLEEDEEAGIWFVEFFDRTFQAKYSFFIATPFWEGAEGIHFLLVDCAGEEACRFEFPFYATSDIDFDADRYVCLVQIAFQLIENHSRGNGSQRVDLDVDPRILHHPMWEPDVYIDLKSARFSNEQILAYFNEAYEDAKACHPEKEET